MADKLVIGCGHLGWRIAAHWRAQGERVFATTRSTSRADEWRAIGLVPIVCDVLDLGSLGPLPNVESIAFCIGLDRTTNISMRWLYVDGLANVLAALKQPPPREFFPIVRFADQLIEFVELRVTSWIPPPGLPQMNS